MLYLRPPKWLKRGMFYFLFLIILVLGNSSCSLVSDDLFETPPPPPEQKIQTDIQPTFESIRANIILPKCISCHQPGEEAELFPLDKIEDLIHPTEEHDPIVIPGQPEKSSFYYLLLPTNTRNRMPPKRTQMWPLSDREILAIETWIRSL